MAERTGRPRGRPKGSPNKLHTEIKAAIVEAFEKAGGVGYLVGIAKKHPAVFCALLGKVLPLQLNVAKTVTHNLDLSAFPDEDLETLRAIVSDATRRPADPTTPTVPGSSAIN